MSNVECFTSLSTDEQTEVLEAARLGLATNWILENMDISDAAAIALQGKLNDQMG